MLFINREQAWRQSIHAKSVIACYLKEIFEDFAFALPLYNCVLNSHQSLLNGLLNIYTLNQKQNTWRKIKVTELQDA